MMFEKDKHMGHIILECLKERPDSICQIDAATGEEETNASALRRSIHLARCLRRLGLVPGDVLALSGRNHLDQQIPYFAALMNGLPITGIDAMLNVDEIKDIFKVTEPKIAFCEPESFNDYVKASRDLGLDTRVYTYGKGEHSMKQLLENYQDNTPIEEFEVATFDEDKVYVWLVSTGGTSGTKKIAAIKHDTLKNKVKDLFFVFRTSASMNQPHKPALNLSSIQWLSGMFQNIRMPMLHQTKVQTSAPATTEHVIDIINKYRPVAATLQPELVSSGILISEKHCDMTCFENIMITGGKVYKDMLQGLRERVNKDTLLYEGYGLTETIGLVFAPNPFGPIGNCGKPYPGLQINLVDPETGKEITEPNMTGEVWAKGTVFSSYYKDPERTASAITKDGWYKTGDLLYRDENDNYFFVERLNMLIKYRSYHIIPRELETVIQSHTGVLNVSVTSIPHEHDGEHPVACVVTRPGCTVTEREIQDLVASKLSDINKLRGGVIFLKELPKTPAGKVAKGKLQKLAYRIKLAKNMPIQKSF